MKKNIVIMAVAILAMTCAYSVFEMLAPAQRAMKNTEIEIPKGSSFRQAADILLKEKLIRDRNVFLILGRITGADRKIKAGYYQIWAGMSPLDIFTVLRKGQIIEYEIRVIEGDIGRLCKGRHNNERGLHETFEGPRVPFRLRHRCSEY
jgi:UPF0755 protein